MPRRPAPDPLSDPSSKLPVATGSVSVVIPTYRGGPFVREAVRSMLDQTVPPLEITVVSDGCPDDLSDLEAIDARVRVISQANAGVSVARNVGVAASSGDLVAFLDEDDRSHPRRLELQLEALTAAPGAAICFGGYQYVDAGGDIIGPPMGQPIGQRDLLELTFPMFPSLMIRRTAVLEAGGYDPALRTCEDVDFCLRVLMRHGATYVPDIICDYRRHGSNTSIGTWDLKPIFEKHRRWAEATGRTDLVAAADLGLKRLRRRASRNAFEASRKAKDRKDLVDTARWLAICMGREPGFLPAVVWSKVAGHPGSSPEAVIPS